MLPRLWTYHVVYVLWIGFSGSSMATHIKTLSEDYAESKIMVFISTERLARASLASARAGDLGGAACSGKHLIVEQANSYLLLLGERAS